MGGSSRARFPRLHLGARTAIAVTAGVLTVAVAVPAVADATTNDGSDQVVVAPTEEPTVEPTTEPTPEPTVEPTVEPPAEPSGEPSAETVTDPTIELGEADEPGSDSFGAWVSAQAHDGGVDGQAISEAAHQRNDERKAAHAAAAPKPARDK
ncbi:hypothetical protein [Cellulomonas terrae]|uniref:Uncharacterized protein n=1 Tax=Cellulomonas terrae TaxID=311234 RepID=A0A511JL44_9CELL|nr:hypothetical protein [Cellulomonas terrae]GEL98718.1 hypothetical protein CTE05_22650 [Cellulomonas terrae]